MAGAEIEMRTYRRNRPRNLMWPRGRDIKENLVHVLDASDHLVVSVDNHSVLIYEVRKVRNRIAHTNSNSRAGFKVVVRRNYGAGVSNILPGSFLLSSRWQRSKIEDYLRRLRLLLRTTMEG